MSREKKRRENEEESWRKEIENYKEKYERKEKKENRKNTERTESQMLPNMVVPQRPHFQVPQFPIMQFQPGQPQYYHQFLVPPGLQMPPPTIIPPIRNVQSEERMDIPGTSTGTQPPQRSPSTGNPDYISPLKREPGIGQPGGTIVVTDR
uniref:Complementary sex determiner n=1 Tax=Romanomermis culicivorax TaxID=13658 RepID=A0A915HUS0_ROMCU